MTLTTDPVSTPALPSVSSSALTFKMATYNIHKGVSAFGKTVRIHGIKDAIALLDADLVFLQEVQGKHDEHALNHALWPQLGQHDFLAGESHQAAYGMNAIYEHGHHGNALLSRFPILSSVNHDVSDHAYEQRGILHSVACVHEREVHCFVIHLGLFAVSRKRQIMALIAEIKRSVPPDAPIIIAGDFNDWSMRLSQRLYDELGVIEAFHLDERAAALGAKRFSLKGMRAMLPQRRVTHARTFPAGLPWLCLDRVYLRGLGVVKAEVMNGAPWIHLSDHVPLAVTLAFAD